MLSLAFVVSLLAPSWEESRNTERQILEFTALTEKNVSTNVRYEYDLRTGGLLKSNNIDESNHMVALEPHLHLWGAHPEFLKSTEDFFRDAMKEIGWKVSAPSFPTPLTKVLSDAEKIPGTFLSSGKEILTSTEEAVSLTRKSLLKFLDLPLLGFLKTELERSDVIEPFQSQVSHDEFRVDAFVLKPLKEYLKAPEKFLSAIRHLQTSMPIYPLRWFFEARELYSIDIRLAVLMLLTHNHQTETLLLQAVAVEEGLEEAWKLAISLSEIYDGERTFWQKNLTAIQIDKELKIVSPSGIQFFDLRQQWKVNVSAKTQVLKPSLAFQSQNNRDHQIWLPYFQLYHFYGAFIVAMRLRKEIGLQEEVLQTVVEAIGLSYKLKTMGWNNDQLSRMRSFYSQGAIDALNFESF